MAAWVDEILEAGGELQFGDAPGSVDLRELVAERQDRLAVAGLRAGGAVAINLPPSWAYVANLFAAWRIGAQVLLLDHRLTAHEVTGAVERLAPQVLVTADVAPVALRPYTDVSEQIRALPGGRAAATDHVLLQLSSGSTGPSKVIGRTARSLSDELDRYAKIDGSPEPGERIVLLASMVHVLGLVGGLLFGLRSGCRVVLPRRLTVDGIHQALLADDRPATVLGVPFHLELLASGAAPPALPGLKRMTTGGELVRPAVHDAFTTRYGVPLGTMYGMTELGVIATDMYGDLRPSLAPAPGITVAERAGELVVRLPASPYVGLADPTRFVDGWLHTRDAGSVDPVTGNVTVHGRQDSQISVGGLKVDLTEVEQVLAGLPGVGGAVVLLDRGIEAYVETADPAPVRHALVERLAAYKRPRHLHTVRRLPRTATGKLLRDRAALRELRSPETERHDHAE